LIYELALFIGSISDFKNEVKIGTSLGWNGLNHGIKTKLRAEITKAKILIFLKHTHCGRFRTLTTAFL
jgi:hypothetical protein